MAAEGAVVDVDELTQWRARAQAAIDRETLQQRFASTEEQIEIALELRRIIEELGNVRRAALRAQSPATGERPTHWFDQIEETSRQVLDVDLQIRHRLIWLVTESTEKRGPDAAIRQRDLRDRLLAHWNRCIRDFKA